MRRFWIAGLIAFLAPSLGMAQDVIGSSIINGKKIEILEDFSWRFEDRLAASCFIVNAQIDFCGAPAGWNALANKPPQIAAAFERDGRNYAFFVAEPAGKNDGVTLEGIGQGVVGNLANGMGIKPSNVPIFWTEETDFYGKEARTIAMQAKLNGVYFVFINTFWVEENVSGQVFTYTYGDQFRDSDRELHQQVIGSLSFKE